jgi:hypothetical protein
VAAVLAYSALWLPPYFNRRSFESWYVLFVAMTGVVATSLVWRLRSPDHGVATGLGLVAGLISLFWPALEVTFQHIDGGGMVLYDNVVYLASVVFSCCALVGGLVTLTRPTLAFRLLTAAVLGTIVVGLAAPSVPPSARAELTLGLPLLAMAWAASWLANRA